MLPRRLFLWLLLTAPVALWLWQASQLPTDDLETLLGPTGDWSARTLIIALALTPLAQLFPHSRAIAWARRHRREIGLAAFGYALLHLAFYVIAMGSLDDILAEALAIGIWPGWLAFALLVPLAVTSSDAAMRAMGRGWKQLQRLAYPAALFTLLHWIFVHNDLFTALAHFAPLAALEAYRLTRSVRSQQGLTHA